MSVFATRSPLFFRCLSVAALGHLAFCLVCRFSRREIVYRPLDLADELADRDDDRERGLAR